MRIVRTGRRRFTAPWLHWCLFDPDCQSAGCPKDIYVHPLGLIFRFDRVAGMTQGSLIHKLWFWWGDEGYFIIRGREFDLPDWPWRIWCFFNRHEVIDDHCHKPEHRFCYICRTPQPYLPVTS